MPRINHIVTNFTAGEISPRLDIRVDLNRYRNGAKYLRNAVVMPHGGVRKRPGSIYVQEVKDSSLTDAPLVVPFEFSTTQAYILEIGPTYIRFFKDGGIIVSGDTRTITGITKANPGVVTYTGTDPSNGDHVYISGVVGMTQVNGRRFTVANVNTGSNTFELSGVNTSSYSTYTSGGSYDTPVQVTTTYAADEIEALSFAQSADTLFIAHVNHPIRKLTRTSHTSWTLTDTTIERGPFRSLNTDAGIVITPTVLGSASISGITRANPAVVTATAHGFAEGASITIAGVSGMTQVNGNRYICRNVTTNTFELWTIAETGVNSTAYGTYSSGGTATIATTTFSTVAPGGKVTLTSNKAVFESGHVGALWRLWEPGQSTGIGEPPLGDPDLDVINNDQYTRDGHVYGITNVSGSYTRWDSILQFPTHERGVVRVPATASGGPSFDVIWLHDSFCVLEILTVSSATVATARIKYGHVPLSVMQFGSSFWEEGAWSTHRGYPGVVTFHESRLWAAASEMDPQTIWASETGAFESFQDGSDATDALVYEIASEKVDVIKWMSPGKVLVLGTPSSEYAAAASSQNEALTPSNVNIRRQTPFGSGVVKPVRVSHAVLFGERKGPQNSPARKVRELTYSFEQDSFIAPDLTIASEHITGSGVEELAYQANPDSVIWGRREDGLMCGLTYEREQEVVGWHLHTMGGAFSTGSAVVERIAVIPGDLGSDLWMIVKRTINGSTRRYIEYLSDGLLDDGEKEDAIYLDSALTYSGSSTTTITGLWHLEGQSVYVLADGYKAGPFTVASGSITLDDAAELVHVGLSYTTIIETLDLEAGAAAGTAKSRQRRITNVFMDVYRSLGGQYGHTTGSMFNILYRTPTDLMGSSPDLKSGLIRCAFPNRWERTASVRIEHSDPYPFSILGFVVEMNTTG